MSDLKNLGNIKLNLDSLKNLNPINPVNDMVSRIQREQQATIQAIQNSKNAKEQEDFRRHNELITALKSAAENGATIVVGDNANGIQIQQNAHNATQTMANSQSFNYDKALDILNEM